MSILRNKSRDRFTVIDNRLIEDERLSGAAIGMALFLFSKPDGWNISTRHLAGIKMPNGKARFGGRDKVRALMGELETAGYIEYRERRGDCGLLAGTEIVLHETPVDRGPENPALGEPTEALKNRPSEKPTAGKSGPLVNTERPLNTETAVNTEGAGAPPADDIYEFPQVKNLCPAAWSRWVAYRRKRKLPRYVTDDMARDLAKLPQEMQSECVRDSIAQGWQGLFPDKPKYTGKKPSVAGMSDEELVAKANELGIYTQGKSGYQLRQEVAAQL